ncbi:uncharacterized protein LOC133344883 isoform X2 [Lethenteron reissneri]|uniref:uncharacterized protein LOC133344883 isoform X2 n=1 Tax=Lethenteron reissneri TaxID=7753 RepID=UPI002AB6297E|nr:uncharacterized protein LOC133344883 isoform X2 [Lethenteron reissneri]
MCFLCMTGVSTCANLMEGTSDSDLEQPMHVSIPYCACTQDLPLTTMDQSNIITKSYETIYNTILCDSNCNVKELTFNTYLGVESWKECYSCAHLSMQTNLTMPSPSAGGVCAVIGCTEPTDCPESVRETERSEVLYFHQVDRRPVYNTDLPYYNSKVNQFAFYDNSGANTDTFSSNDQDDIATNRQAGYKSLTFGVGGCKGSGCQCMQPTKLCRTISPIVSDVKYSVSDGGFGQNNIYSVLHVSKAELYSQNFIEAHNRASKGEFVCFQKDGCDTCTIDDIRFRSINSENTFEGKTLDCSCSNHGECLCTGLRPHLISHSNKNVIPVYVPMKGYTAREELDACTNIAPHMVRSLPHEWLLNPNYIEESAYPNSNRLHKLVAIFDAERPSLIDRLRPDVSTLKQEMSTGMAHPAEYPGQTPVECINVFDELSGKLGLTVEEIKDLVSDEDNLKDLCNLVDTNGMFSNEDAHSQGAAVNNVPMPQVMHSNHSQGDGGLHCINGGRNSCPDSQSMHGIDKDQDRPDHEAAYFDGPPVNSASPLLALAQGTQLESHIGVGEKEKKNVMEGRKKRPASVRQQEDKQSKDRQYVLINRKEKKRKQDIQKGFKNPWRQLPANVKDYRSSKHTQNTIMRSTCDHIIDLKRDMQKNGHVEPDHQQGSNTETVEAEGAHYELPLGTTEEGNNQDLSSDDKLSKNKFLKFKMKYQHHLKNIFPRMGIKETKRLVNVKWHSMRLAEKQLYINRCHHRELTEQGNDDSSLKYSTRPSFPKKTDGMAETRSNRLRDWQYLRKLKQQTEKRQMLQWIMGAVKTWRNRKRCRRRNCRSGLKQKGSICEDNWVQCDTCDKWRKLPLGTNLDTLPEKWGCDVPEQPWEDDGVVPENRRDEKSPSSSVQCKLESGSTSGVGAQE